MSDPHVVDDSQGGPLSQSHSHDHLVRISDASLMLLMMTPLQLLTKGQRVNVSNRIIQLLADRSMDRSVIAVALNMLVLFMEKPSNTMILLKKPNLTSEENVPSDQETSTAWLFGIAAWLDEVSRDIGPDVRAVMKLKQLAVLILQSVHTSHCQSKFF